MHRLLIASVAATLGLGPAFAAPPCINAGHWTYAGSDKDGSVRDFGAATLLEFSPTDPDRKVQALFVMIVDPGTAGTYQMNADFDLKHMSEDGSFTLSGATSAIPGRDFDVKVTQGDSGTGSFSRPVTTTGRPFQVMFRTHGAVSLMVRDVKLCRLR